MCDGVDSDCSGAIDDAPGLCPGGLCVAGRCDFDAWDNAFGTASDDTASAVAIDGSGNIYVAVSVGEGSVDFGGGDRVVPSFREGVAVIKYAPDGTYLWDYMNTGAGRANSMRIAVNDAGRERVHPRAQRHRIARVGSVVRLHRRQRLGDRRHDVGGRRCLGGG